jgi:DNA modification methylase
VTATAFPTDHASGTPYGLLDENACREQLSLSYVHAVAAAARCSMERTGIDYQQIDVTIKQTAPHSLIEYANLDIQIKATSKDVLKADAVHYALPKKYYDSLRSMKRNNKIILVVVVLPDRLEDWVLQSEDDLRMRRAGYWLSLRGYPEIQTGSKTLKIPRANVFSVEELLGIMSRIGNGGAP